MDVAEAVEPRGYEYFDHTADVGIRAWGATLDEAFAQAARGLIANMVEVANAKAVGEARLEVTGENIERLLFTFLDDVLDLFYTKMWVFCEVEVRLQGDTQLTAILRGEAYDPVRHGHVHEIKAMTWHGLEVHRSPPEVRVVVDI
jgi:SHS2 domain-containing protein